MCSTSSTFKRERCQSYRFVCKMVLFYQVILSLVLIINLKDAEGLSVEEDLTLTFNQKIALDKFRERVESLLTKPWQQQDIYLIRWLRARDFDLNRAEQMLRTHLSWRKNNNIDKILNEDWSDMEKDFPQTMDTYDKTGRPVGTIDMTQGSWDIRRGALEGKGPRMLRYMDYLMENVTMQVYQRQMMGMNVTQWVCLATAEGFNLIQQGCPPCIPLWIQFIQSLENNYPGVLNEYILVDAPSTIRIILQAVRPFLRQETRDSFTIFGPNRNKWLPYLDSKIDRSERRIMYAGTKK